MKRIINGLEWEIIDPTDHLFLKTLTGTISVMTTEDKKVAIRELHAYRDEHGTLRCPTCERAVIAGTRKSRDHLTPGHIHFFYCKNCDFVLTQ